jgi:ornithine cyclodeaminase
MSGETLSIYDARETRAALPFGELIESLRSAFHRNAPVPVRHHHDLPQKNGRHATLLLMPAWERGGFLGTKIVTVHSGNTQLGLPSVHSTYLLADEATGAPVAILDGNEITARRTAAVSALAAASLARRSSQTMLLVGAGRVASLLPAAMREVLPIRRVLVWNRNGERAADLVRALRDQGFAADVAGDLAAAVAASDVVSCATLATTPLIRRAWLKPGTHLDLVGGFTPSMREADDQCIVDARLYVDTIAALSEAGDLSQPLSAGLIEETDIVATLSGLCSGEDKGRQCEEEITLFKSVGTAIADLAAGVLAHRFLGAGAGR